MRLATKRGVLNEEHKRARGLADWDNVRMFLEVVRRGSFRSAAERVGQSINAVRRQIDRFEHDIGAVLFTRDVLGTRLTDEGARVVDAAERMEAASFDILRNAELAAPTIAGEVRVAVTEGIGTFWLAPRLVEFQRSFPNILVDLHCAMRSADVLRHEADVAIQLVRPAALDAKAVKIGRLHVMWYASHQYFELYGRPTTYSELLKHRLVMQFADQTSAEEAFQEWFPGMSHADLLVMRTNVSSANYWAIAKGAGIGILPTYASAIGARVEPVDVEGMHRPFDIWLSYHPGAGRIPRIRKMIDWIVDSFSAAQFPWFSDTFIHPNELSQLYKGKPLVNMFEGFAAAAD